MKISVNINPLLNANKSGIGYYQTELLKAMLKVDGENKYCFNSFRTRKNDQLLPEWFPTDSEYEICSKMPISIYQLMCGFLPIPYSFVIKSESDVSLFFNFFLPPVIKGKKVLVVYDTVIKDFPDTVKGKNRLLLNLNLKRSIRQADLIITISQFSKQQIIRHYMVDERKIVVIPCAADISRFYTVENFAMPDNILQKYNIPEKYYLYLGTLEPRKNIPRLIEGYYKARKQDNNLPSLVIAGGKGWMYNDIFERVYELNLENYVIFTGYVDNNHVPDLMRGAKAFCFPSLYEGFGMPPLEAMACGVPVIVSDCSSLPEVVGDCGIKVNPYSVDEIASALIKANNEDFYNHQRKIGMNQVASFSWERSAIKLIKCLNELIIK